MTDSEIIKVGDICLYFYDNDNKSISIVEVVEDLSTDVLVVKFLQVVVDDSGNGLFDYLYRAEKTMNVSRKYLHKIDLINRQQAEIEDSQMDKEQLKRAVINANMKGEHLQAENKRLLTEFLRFKEEIAQPYLLINCDDKSVEVLRERLKKQKVIPVPYNEATVEILDKASIRAEAVKEFAKRLKKRTYPFPCAIGVENVVTIRAIDDLVKEMVGETE